MTWLALDCELDTRRTVDDATNEPDAVRDNLVGVAYLLPVITECTDDDHAETILSTVAGEQKDSMKESAAYHIQWAHLVAKAFREKRRATGPITLGDLVSPVKMSVPWPFVVVDAQYNKTGVLDLDTGEPKYFAADFVARLQGLRMKQSDVH